MFLQDLDTSPILAALVILLLVFATIGVWVCAADGYYGFWMGLLYQGAVFLITLLLLQYLGIIAGLIEGIFHTGKDAALAAIPLVGLFLPVGTSCW